MPRLPISSTLSNATYDYMLLTSVLKAGTVVVERLFNVSATLFTAVVLAIVSFATIDKSGVMFIPSLPWYI